MLLCVDIFFEHEEDIHMFDEVLNKYVEKNKIENPKWMKICIFVAFIGAVITGIAYLISLPCEWVKTLGMLISIGAALFMLHKKDNRILVTSAGRSTDKFYMKMQSLLEESNVSDCVDGFITICDDEIQGYKPYKLDVSTILSGCVAPLLVHIAISILQQNMEMAVIVLPLYIFAIVLVIITIDYSNRFSNDAEEKRINRIKRFKYDLILYNKLKESGYKIQKK